MIARAIRVIPVFGEPSLVLVTGEPEVGRRTAINYGGIVQVAFAKRGEPEVSNVGNKVRAPGIWHSGYRERNRSTRLTFGHLNFI
jgi:hypothetical protein